jgi:hypothetical protein
VAAVREVQSPDGRVWRVRRVWLPRRPWLPVEDAVDRGRPYIWGYGGVDWWVVDRIVVPAVMLAGDLVWFVLSLPFVIGGRFLLRRPWRVRAVTIGRPRMTREIEAVGWPGSREAIDRLATEIASGR